MKSWWSEFDRAVFGYGSPVAMGVFRAVVGFLAFCSVAISFYHQEAFFSERGLFPQWMAERWSGGVPRFNLLAGVTSDGVVTVFFLIVLAAALLTSVGLFTRVASIVLLLGVVSLHHRSPDILHSGDTLLRMWLFIVAVAPSGRAFSLDRVIGLRRGTAPLEHELVSLWPQRLAQFQLAVVYFTTVWLKWFGSFWRDGTATWYPMHLGEFERFPLPSLVFDPTVVMLTTYGTLLVELALATLVFAKPLRKWVLLAGLGLHGYIEYSMNVPLFQWIIVAGFICHYSGEEVSAWARGLEARPWGRWLGFWRGWAGGKEVPVAGTA